MINNKYLLILILILNCNSNVNANANDVVFSIDKKIYNNSLKIEQENKYIKIKETKSDYFNCTNWIPEASTINYGTIFQQEQECEYELTETYTSSSGISKDIKTLLKEKITRDSIGTLNNIVSLSNLIIDNVTNTGMTFYGCTSFVKCLQSKSTWQQRKISSTTIDFNFSKKVKINDLDWFYNISSPNINKYPRNIDIYYYDNNNNLVLHSKINNLQRDLDQKINLNKIEGFYSKYRFVFYGSTDGWGYLALQYLNINGSIEN